MAVRLWKKALWAQSINENPLSKLVGDSKNSLIFRHSELEKGAGSRLTYSLKRLMTGRGVTGDNVLEGNEEALNFFQDDIFIDQLRHATRGRQDVGAARSTQHAQRRHGLAWSVAC
jgi:hypothetical protein